MPEKREYEVQQYGADIRVFRNEMPKKEIPELSAEITSLLSRFLQAAKDEIASIRAAGENDKHIIAQVNRAFSHLTKTISANEGKDDAYMKGVLTGLRTAQHAFDEALNGDGKSQIDRILEKRERGQAEHG